MVPNWVPLAALIGAGIAVYSGRWLEVVLATIVAGVGLFGYAYFRGGSAATGSASRDAPGSHETGDQQGNK
jgi:hypothetical protein